MESDTQAVKPTGRANARLSQTVRDMVWSMVVVLAVVGVIMALAWRPDPSPVRTVDPMPSIAFAVAQADFALLAPADLPAGWMVTSARWEPTQASQGEPLLHIGYVTPSGGYIQLTEYATDATSVEDIQDTAVFRERVGAIAIDGVTAIDGQTWQTGAGSEGAVLLSLDEGRFIALSGTAEIEELRFLAASLEPSN